MLIAVDWLQEFVSKKFTPASLSSTLESAGIEVENIRQLPKYDNRIVVAEVRKIKRHPNADRLKLADVYNGQKTIEIVCGAPNVEAGQKVAFAQVGAKLPNGQTIQAVDIRGVKSPGMLLSESELGLSTDHSGLLILDSRLTPGNKLTQVFGAGTVLDVKTAANRPDLNGLVGIAREVAAQTTAQLKFKDNTELNSRSAQHFENRVKKLVPRYALARLKLPAKLPITPDFMRQRLALSGQRSINLVVDITNYVMLETAQPLHGFDEAKIANKIVIRKAKSNEKLATLDGVERKLTTEDLVIADSRGALGLAGVKGGQSSEITTDTKAVLLEAANFDGLIIRKSAQRHGLRTEASARFERGLPVQTVATGMNRALELFKKYAKAKVDWIEDELNYQPSLIRVKTRPERLTQLAGFTISAEAATASLKKLKFEVQPAGNSLQVSAPWWRTDIQLEEDIFEEVIKLLGLQKIAATLPTWQPAKIKPVDHTEAAMQDVRSVMLGLGASEVMTYPFVSTLDLAELGLEVKKHWQVTNPLTAEQTHLTSTLLPNLLKAVASNSKRQAQFILFELATTFHKGQAENEAPRLGVISIAPDGGYRQVKNALDNLTRLFNIEARIVKTKLYSYLTPSRQAVIRVGQSTLGYIGEVTPELLTKHKVKGSVGYLELDLRGLFKELQQFYFKPIPKYPMVSRDLTAVIAPRVGWSDLKKSLESVNGVQVHYLGDYQEANGQRSISFRLKIMPMDLSLSAKDIDETVKLVQSTLSRQLAAKFKG